MVRGNTAATGYLAFYHKDGTRCGYIGDASGGLINLAAEGGYAWSFTGNATFGGNLTAGSRALFSGGTYDPGDLSTKGTDGGLKGSGNYG